MGNTVSTYVFRPPPYPTYIDDHGHLPYIDSSNTTQPQTVPLYWVYTAHNSKIPIIHFMQPNSEQTVIFSHDNAVDLGMICWYCQKLSEEVGIDVVSYDYTGYGLSENKNINTKHENKLSKRGNYHHHYHYHHRNKKNNSDGGSVGSGSGMPSEKNCYNDILAVYEWVIQNRIGGKKRLPQDIILIGRSVGSGPTIELASRIKNIGGIILVSAFMSIIKIVTCSNSHHHHHGIADDRLLKNQKGGNNHNGGIGIGVSSIIGGRGLLGGIGGILGGMGVDMFCNIDKISKINCPKLILHARGDRLVSIRHGEELYKKCREGTAMAIWLDQGGHNDVELENWSVILEIYKQFLNRVMVINKQKRERALYEERYMDDGDGDGYDDNDGNGGSSHRRDSLRRREGGTGYGEGLKRKLMRLKLITDPSGSSPSVAHKSNGGGKRYTQSNSTRGGTRHGDDSLAKDKLVTNMGVGSSSTYATRGEEEEEEGEQEEEEMECNCNHQLCKICAPSCRSVPIPTSVRAEHNTELNGIPTDDGPLDLDSALSKPGRMRSFSFHEGDFRRGDYLSSEFRNRGKSKVVEDDRYHHRRGGGPSLQTEMFKSSTTRRALISEKGEGDVDGGCNRHHTDTVQSPVMEEFELRASFGSHNPEPSNVSSRRLSKGDPCQEQPQQSASNGVSSLYVDNCLKKGVSPGRGHGGHGTDGVADSSGGGGGGGGGDGRNDDKRHYKQRVTRGGGRGRKGGGLRHHEEEYGIKVRNDVGRNYGSNRRKSGSRRDLLFACVRGVR